ncbi:Eco57I restriction-modification methylase domain-containing protein, partial [Streptomyces rubiginosohelvolus]
MAGLVATALEEDADVPGSSVAGDRARGVVARWLKGERAAAVRPLHWPLEFPEIMGVGGASGCDAIEGHTPCSAQGDTREVGLDQATAGGWSVYRAIKSQPWPGTAALEVSLLWLGGRMGEGEQPVLNGGEVRGITSWLDPQSSVSGKPYRLAANAGQSFIGSYVLGKGFILQPEAAQALIEKDPRNEEVLFPYLNGEDLNSRPDCSASRWVINF